MSDGRFRFYKKNNRWWCDFPMGRASFGTYKRATSWAQGWYTNVIEGGQNGSES